MLTLVLPGPFLANRFPLEYQNGTVFAPTPQGKPGQPLVHSPLTEYEYAALLAGGVAILVVANVLLVRHRRRAQTSVI